MMQLAVDTITAAANAAGITSVTEGSETISDRLKPALPRLEYVVLADDFDRVRTGIISATRDGDTEHRVRRLHRWTFRIRCLIAAETEVDVESVFKLFLKFLPRNAADDDGITVRIAPQRAERKGFSRQLVEVFPKKEIAVIITFTGGIHTSEEIDLIKEINITPEVQ